MSDAVVIESNLSDLKNRLAQAEHERDEYRKLYELMRVENERLRLGLIGQRAERLPEGVEQLSLQILGQLVGGQEEVAPERKQQAVKPHTRRRPTGRKPLPDELPIVRLEFVPDHVAEDPDAYECIGEEVSETLERRPSSFVRVQSVRKKYVRKDRDKNGPTTVTISEPPELPIERGLAGPGLLADSIVKRWDDHLPLNRLERIYAREGVELARSTICGWHIELAELAQALVQAMLADALRAPYLCTDATGVLVQHKEQCKNGHFWVLVAPELHVLFRYSAHHDGAAVDALLGTYEGYLVADAHTVYDHLYATGRVTECGCWAHSRRYFFKSLQSDPDRAKEALAIIASLFRIEREMAGSPRKKRESVRGEKSKPLVDRFFDWCTTERDRVLDETPISKAIAYAQNQRAALERFLSDGRLPMDNNVSERELRREVVGRKNWLFLGSDDGALANTTFVSLLASCRLHGIEPWAYMRDLLCLLPRWPSKRVLDLAPAYWRKTAEMEETQRRLETNPFRHVTIMSPDMGPHDLRL